jgi:hypothetical protein
MINWSLVYNNSDNEGSNLGSRLMNRLCEFFVIDASEDFQIWNLNKSKDKPVKVINFAKQHDSLEDQHHCVFSMPAPDQTFFTGFATTDLSVKLYSMNFHKGSQINK